MAYLFFIFLVLLPSQLGKHWWPQWSMVSGVRVDYLSPTLYLTDIVLISLVGFVLWKNRKSVRNLLRHSFSFSVLLLIAYCLLFIVYSPRPLLSLYWTIRYLEIPLVVWVTRRICNTISASRFRQITAVGLSIGIAWTTILSVTQVSAGKTIGLWILGERTFTVATPGIAILSVFGRTMLRPYATFPHPNALAGFFALCFLLFSTRHFLHMKFTRLSRVFAGIGVFLSASRLAIAGLAIALLAPLVTSRVHTLIAFSPQSTQERIALARAATAMFLDHPLFGVGAGQFLHYLPEYLPRGMWLLQPVHNIPLLLLAEFGIVGTILLIVFFWKFLKIIRFSTPIRSLPPTAYSLLIFFMLTSLGDHYWVTVQQNRLLLGVVLALVTINRGKRRLHC